MDSNEECIELNKSFDWILKPSIIKDLYGCQELAIDFGFKWRLQLRRNEFGHQIRSKANLELTYTVVNDVLLKFSVRDGDNTLATLDYHPMRKGSEVSLWYHWVYPEVVPKVDVDLSLRISKKQFYDKVMNESDLKSLYCNPLLSDFTLVVDGTEFPIHSPILSSRSTFFAAKFDKNSTEWEGKRIALNDIEAPVLEAILKYLYFGDKSIESMTKQVFRVADKYLLLELKEFCGQFESPVLKGLSTIRKRKTNIIQTQEF